MKKNILIGVLVVMTMLSFMYAYVQQAEAVKQRQRAELNEREAIEAKAQSVECRIAAEAMQKATAEALNATQAQMRLAEEAAKKK
jgi:hypothetical protein